MQKNIVILYGGNDWNKRTPFSANSEATRLSFEDWYTRAEKYNIKFYRASIDWYDEKTNSVKKTWTFENNSWIKVNKAIKPYALFDKVSGKYDYALFEKKLTAAGKVPFINSPLFHTITNNKLSQYMLFSEHMPKSYVAHNKKQLVNIFSKMKLKKIVIKPLQGSGGFGIFIGNIKTAQNKRFTYPVLIQEFVPSTKGIPGFSQKNEVADLRLVYANHKLIYALSRIAKKDSLLTNFHQGANVVIVPKNKIPKSTLTVAKKIISKLSIFPNAHYSLDFIFTNSNKPLLLEMNTMPGFCLLHLIGTEQIRERNFKLFLDSVDVKY